MKAIRSVKEYVEVEYFGEKSIVPVYQYYCYISSYEIDTAQLHEIYKQRSTSEIWIEQVKGQTMAGSTLTDDFWANDILWQLSVFANNLSVTMRQKKNRFKRQERQTFIDGFISVPAKITGSGHQMEINYMNIIFIKPNRRSSTGSSRRHKKRRKEENMKINPRVHGRGTFNQLIKCK